MDPSSRHLVSYLSFVPRLLQSCIGVFGVCLFILASEGCQERTPPAAKPVNLALDKCIAQATVLITQGTTSESRDVDLSDGAGRVEFTQPFDWTTPVDVKITVKRLKPECETSIAVTDYFEFSGLIPQPSGAATLATADLLDRYVTIGLPGNGTTGAGPCTTTRGPGIALWVKLDGTGCTATCWQQWANTQLFYIRAAGNVEIANGRQFRDASNNQHRFGKYERDLPTGSTNNCFREDNVPGRPGIKGIVDAPNVPATNNDATALFSASARALRLAGVDPIPAPLTVRVTFTMFSVLWCEQPASATILGYYTWTAHQDWTFGDNPNPPPTVKITVSPSTIDSPATWHAGAAGLPPGTEVH